MARPRNEDKPVNMTILAPVFLAGIIPSIETTVHKGDVVTVTRKEADAMELFGYAAEVSAEDE